MHICFTEKVRIYITSKYFSFSSQKYSCIILRLNTYLMIFINMIHKAAHSPFKNRSSGFSVSLQATQTRSLAPADKGRSVTTNVAITTKATRKSIPHRPPQTSCGSRLNVFLESRFWYCWNSKDFLGLEFISCLRTFQSSEPEFGEDSLY